MSSFAPISIGFIITSQQFRYRLVTHSLVPFSLVGQWLLIRRRGLKPASDCDILPSLAASAFGVSDWKRFPRLFLNNRLMLSDAKAAAARGYRHPCADYETSPIGNFAIDLAGFCLQCEAEQCFVDALFRSKRTKSHQRAKATSQPMLKRSIISGTKGKMTIRFLEHSHRRWACFPNSPICQVAKS